MPILNGFTSILRFRALCALSSSAAAAPRHQGEHARPRRVHGAHPGLRGISGTMTDDTCSTEFSLSYSRMSETENATGAASHGRKLQSASVGALEASILQYCDK